jgi:hypothetical protein
MTEFKFSGATVRIHGNCSKETLKAASECFMKKAIKQQKEKAKCSRSTN